MDTWTLIATFIVGVTFGFAGLTLALWCLIRLDDKQKLKEKAAHKLAERLDVSYEEALARMTIDRIEIP